MSRGLSQRQRWMLGSIARQTSGHKNAVAWREIDDGTTGCEDNYDLSARAEWNREQSVRRALRSLEQHGLVRLRRYSFDPEVRGELLPQIVWTRFCGRVRGQTRTMTGVRLTDAGWALVAEEEAKEPRAAD
jgi:hypothetical protein